MTKEKIIENYKKFKVIEYREKGYKLEEDPEWKILEIPEDLNPDKFDYRISKNKHWGSYNNGAEILEDLKKHGPYICNDKEYISIEHIGKKLASITYWVLDNEFGHLFTSGSADCLKKFTWQDGKIFGIIEED